MRMISIFIICFMVCFYSLVSCGDDSDNDNLTSSGTYSLTLGDDSVDYPDGTYYASVFEGTTFNSQASVTSAGPMTSSSSVKIENLTTGVVSSIYIWIDSDGGDTFVPDKYIYATNQSDIAGEYEVIISGMVSDVATTANRDVRISSASNIDAVAHVIWLVMRSHLDEVDVADLYSEAGRAACRHMVGYANKNMGGSSDVVVGEDSDYEWPLPSSVFDDFRYTLVVLVDTNGNGVRDGGDWEGITEQVNAKKDIEEQITIELISK